MQNLLLDMHWTGKVDSVAFSIGGFEVQWYGIFITCAMLIGLLIGTRRCKRLNISSDDMLAAFLWAIPLAIFGARLGYVVSRYEMYFTSPYDWEAFVNTIAIWKGGLTIMWGVPFGVLGGMIWAKIHKINFIRVADLVLPVVLLCQALGRWGNFFNQELYGQMITNPSLQWFPMAVYISGEGAWFQATFFYEMVLNIIGFFVISYVATHVDKKGIGILGYIVWYCSVRGGLEFIRDDGASSFDQVNVVAILCFVMVAIALITATVLLVIDKKKGRKVFYKHGIPKEAYLGTQTQEEQV